MVRRATSDQQMIAFHQLIIMAFFFAMRSCEYLLTTGNERRTKTLQMRNFQFTKNHQVLPLDSPILEQADCVTITFEFQKNDHRDEQITQQRTGHPLLCPVQACAAIVHRIQAFGGDLNTFVYEYERADGRRAAVTSTACAADLKAFIRSLPYKAYGLHPDHIGLHSIRSSAAMAMYLNDIPVATIMLLGRWSSNAFLRYIRTQVEQYSKKVSAAMIQNPMFHHVADPSRDEDSFEHLERDPLANRPAVFAVWH